MRKRQLRGPNPALVISLIALFVALGGTTYAATSLPKNSVGAKQLKKNAVTSAKIKNGAVTAAKLKNGLTVPLAAHATDADSATHADSATSSASATNASHATTADSATSATHATNADSAGDATNASNLGGHSSSFYAPVTLQSGQTESGNYAIAGGDSTSGHAVEAFTFPHPLAAALDGSHVQWLSGTTSANCPGVGQAAAGYLCVYAESTNNLTGDAVLPIKDHTPNNGADSYGFMMLFVVTGADSISWGTWTVKAP